MEKDWSSTFPATNGNMYIRLSAPEENQNTAMPNVLVVIRAHKPDPFQQRLLVDWHSQVARYRSQAAGKMNLHFLLSFDLTSNKATIRYRKKSRWSPKETVMSRLQATSWKSEFTSGLDRNTDQSARDSSSTCQRRV